MLLTMSTMFTTSTVSSSWYNLLRDMSDEAARPELFFQLLFVLSKASLQCHISSTCHTVLVCSKSNVCILTSCWRYRLCQLVFNNNNTNNRFALRLLLLLLLLDTSRHSM